MEFYSPLPERKMPLCHVVPGKSRIENAVTAARNAPRRPPADVKQSLHDRHSGLCSRALRFHSFLPVEMYLLQFCLRGLSFRRPRALRGPHRRRPARRCTVGGRDGRRASPPRGYGLPGRRHAQPAGSGAAGQAVRGHARGVRSRSRCRDHHGVRAWTTGRRNPGSLARRRREPREPGRAVVCGQRGARERAAAQPGCCGGRSAPAARGRGLPT